MKQLVTSAIVLSRTDYGEADRIVSVLTPDHGKLRLMAKGVRRVKSKLAGGIELFSVSTITFVRGRGEIGTLVSTRLSRNYGNIVKDLARTQVGYDCLKRLNKATEDAAEPAYFALLEHIFDALNDYSVSTEIVQLWFAMQLLSLAGHEPNLHTDTAGNSLQLEQTYAFDTEHMAFVPHSAGHFSARHIKFLRLGFAGYTPKTLAQVQGAAELVDVCVPLVELLQRQQPAA